MARTICLEWTLAPRPCEVWVIPAQFPLAESDLAPLRDFFARFSDAAGRALGLSPEVFLQFAQLQVGDRAATLTEHARAWRPQQGLGVFPDRKPPAMWTVEECLDLEPGPRAVLMHQVFHVQGGPEASRDARDRMLGAGVVVQIMTAEGSEALLQKGKELLLAPIQDPTFRAFPLYIPLLEKRSFARAKASQVSEWLCGASVYVRESAEDEAILIVSQEPLGPVLRQLGGVFDDRERPVWRIAVA